MSDPLEYRVLTNLRDALQAIRTSDGYHQDVRGTAVKLDPNQGVEALVAPDGPRPFIVLEVLPERRVYQPSFVVKIWRPVTIHWVSESDPTRDPDRLRTFFEGCADVERAVAGTETSRRRGGLAQDTVILRTTFDPALEGSQVWAQIETEILMIRTYGQPDVTS